MGVAVKTFLTLVFIDNFFLSATIVIALMISLYAKPRSNFRMPDAWAAYAWWFIVISAGAVASLLTAQLYEYPQGVGRLEVIAVFVCASPLFIAAGLAIFVFRRR